MSTNQTHITTTRRNTLRGAAAVLTAGSIALAAGATTASAATHPTALAGSVHAASKVSHPLLRLGSHGSAVKALQARLTQLGYVSGGADGWYGDLTRQAVMAVQKVAGLERDGIAGPHTWATIDAGVRPKARTTRGHVIEVDKATQTLRVVDNGRVTWTINASTGSGKRYTSTWKGEKHTSVAITPDADNLVFRSVRGWDNGPLGELYAPMYFKGGIAVHGLQSVPAHAASHGCVRVSIPAMDFLRNKGLIKVGTRVLVR